MHTHAEHYTHRHTDTRGFRPLWYSQSTTVNLTLVYVERICTNYRARWSNCWSKKSMQIPSQREKEAQVLAFWWRDRQGPGSSQRREIRTSKRRSVACWPSTSMVVDLNIILRELGDASKHQRRNLRRLITIAFVFSASVVARLSAPVARLTCRQGETWALPAPVC